jgi:hypothetical protein
MREEYDPSVSDEVVEFDGSLSSIGFEVRGSAAQSQFLLLNTCGGAGHF